MKGIHTLIKMHKRSLDELRRRMVVLENQKAQMRAQVAALGNELEAELKLVGTQVEMAGFYGDFAKRIRDRQAEIMRNIAALDKKIGALNEEIRVAFAELKKFEIARDNAKRRAQEAQNRKDTILLDEIAIQQHVRKENI